MNARFVDRRPELLAWYDAGLISVVMMGVLTWIADRFAGVDVPPFAAGLVVVVSAWSLRGMVERYLHDR